MATELTYQTFEKEITNTDKTVIVDFWAPWCGPCRSQGPILDMFADEMADRVKVCKVNVDDEYDLSKRFGIMNIPTLIVFKNGKMINKVSGLQNFDDLTELIKD
ncbi:MAG: thioredoxin [Clostridia bacterium]|nr:thioredoxin [Clostridia bacterium]